MTTSAFALRSFNGAPKRFFFVESQALDQAKPVAKKKPSHHIIVVDRSGSMYGDMDPMKLMTAEQFVEKFPEAKLSKKEKEEGTFFLLPSGLVITVYVENVYYSTGA